jgi:hypothetical protein
MNGLPLPIIEKATGNHWWNFGIITSGSRFNRLLMETFWPPLGQYCRSSVQRFRLL